MKNVEGLQHEIEYSLDEALTHFNWAKDAMRAAEAWSIYSGEGMSGSPLKMAAHISEIMAQLEAAHKFLIEAAKLQREKDQQEAAEWAP